MKLTPNRMGKFSISLELFEQGWEKLVPLLEGMFILEARFSYDSRAWEYLALSEKFDLVQEGSPAPDYKIEFTRDQNGKVLELRWFKRR